MAGPLGLFAEISEVENFPFFDGEPGDGEHPLHAHGEPDAADVWAAEILHHVVVPAAAEEGVLGAEASGNDLESRLRVVVEAANQAGLHPVGDLEEIERSRGAP